MPGIGSFNATGAVRARDVRRRICSQFRYNHRVRRTLGEQRRRIALITLPLAGVFTVTTASQGLWILAIPGLLFFAFQLVTFIRESRRRPRPAPSPSPAERPTPPRAVTSTPPSPGGARAGRRTSPRDRAAARRQDRHGR